MHKLIYSILPIRQSYICSKKKKNTIYSKCFWGCINGHIALGDGYIGKDPKLYIYVLDVSSDTPCIGGFLSDVVVPIENVFGECDSFGLGYNIHKCARIVRLDYPEALLTLYSSSGECLKCDTYGGGKLRLLRPTEAMLSAQNYPTTMCLIKGFVFNRISDFGFSPISLIYLNPNMSPTPDNKSANEISRVIFQRKDEINKRRSVWYPKKGK